MAGHTTDWLLLRLAPDLPSAILTCSPIRIVVAVGPRSPVGYTTSAFSQVRAQLRLAPDLPSAILIPSSERNHKRLRLAPDLPSAILIPVPLIGAVSLRLAPDLPSAILVRAKSTRHLPSAILRNRRDNDIALRLAPDLPSAILLLNNKLAMVQLRWPPISRRLYSEQRTSAT